MSLQNAKLKSQLRDTNTSEKLKEIKQRQQNWMRQRASSLDRDRARSTSPSVCLTSLEAEENFSAEPKTASSASFERTVSGQKTQVTAATFANNINTTALKPPAKPKGFQRWRQNKKEVTNSKDHRNVPKDTEINVLQINHDTGSQATQSPSDSISSSRTISPERFDDLANQIVCRVKRELNISPLDQHPSKEIVCSQNLSSNRSGRNSTVESHCCPNCKKLMVLPDHSPMLLIPCGHSFCESCAKSDVCPSCRQVVQSMACNIMLQKIIAEYNSMPVESPHRELEHRPTKHDDNLSEEYQSLCLRCEAVSMEIEDIANTLDEFHQNIKEEQQQIENIAAAQEKLTAEIQNLQTKLSDLDRHKDEYHGKIDGWKKQQEVQRNKLEMAQDLLCQLEMKKKKVRQLLEIET